MVLESPPVWCAVKKLHTRSSLRLVPFPIINFSLYLFTERNFPWSVNFDIPSIQLMVLNKSKLHWKYKIAQSYN